MYLLCRVTLDDCKAIGTITTTKVATNVAECIQRNTGVFVELASIFFSVCVNGKFTILSHTQGSHGSIYTVCYAQGGENCYGLIEYFISFQQQTLAVSRIIR